MDLAGFMLEDATAALRRANWRSAMADDMVFGGWWLDARGFAGQ